MQVVINRENLSREVKINIECKFEKKVIVGRGGRGGGIILFKNTKLKKKKNRISYIYLIWQD